MNNKQIVTLGIGILLIMLSGLFPPWYHNLPGYGFVHRGFGFLLHPGVGYRIYFGQLILEWALIAVFAGALIFLWRDKQH